MKTTALLTTTLGDYPKRSGKVRDIYDLQEHLLIVATDRISAYDVVMPNGIPDKGRVLTQISVFWFRKLAEICPHHLVSAAMKDLPEAIRQEDELDGRFMLCRKAEVVPIECIVRGYLAGSGWREYKEQGTVCGIELPEGLKKSSPLPEPVFTPSTKAEQGEHDENISFEKGCEIVGEETMSQLRDLSIALYSAARDYASERGILLADTKFEFGRDDNGQVILIDECLTPDSSRFWPADQYKPGRNQPSFDKQFVRDYLDKIKFDRTPPAPPLPPEIVQKTREKYIDAYAKLTGEDFPWA
ncbi:MAG: phosphoribosylaminoimidazolesuccinocarboxamide synthase [Planctomycetes bacterium]|jgi:phosphoribosylaminoimidazole-succinocarboxamide synthase|nr:phosphoribosylaminoimidazolesuccinocarboxamide synthase [Phycisphaerae bacterium]NBB94906.1 phosphoribosylaminoimidazolesuccinocarboxamide synthase [Planctomycetota bacterium]